MGNSTDPVRYEGPSPSSRRDRDSYTYCPALNTGTRQMFIQCLTAQASTSPSRKSGKKGPISGRVRWRISLIAPEAGPQRYLR
jgi:hypothetical protein